MTRYRNLLDACWKTGTDHRVSPSLVCGMPRTFAAIGLAAILALVSLAGNARAASLPTNLIAYWNVNEGSGTVINDTAPTGVSTDTGTFGSSTAAPTWIAGKLGGGLRLDGVNDYVDIPASTDLNIGTNTMTISLWVNLDTLPSGLAGAWAGIYDSASDCYNVYLDKGANELRLKIQDVTGAAARPGISGSSLSTGSWHLVTAEYDGTVSPKGVAKIYWDGVLKDTHYGDDGGVNPLVGNVKTGQAARLGNDTGATYYAGALDDIGIWKDALSDGETAALYNLAVDSQFQMALGTVDQLFGLHDLASSTESLTISGLSWKYATGLGAYTLGVPTHVGENVYLRLDAAGTGLLATVPEPASITLLGLGVLLGVPVLLHRRRRIAVL